MSEKKTAPKKATAKKKAAPKRGAAAAPARSARPRKVVKVAPKAKAPIVPEVLPPIITVDQPTAISRTPGALMTVNDNGSIQLGKSVINVINDLPTATDKQLQYLLRGSTEMERAAWVLKGATAHEVVKRATAEGSQFSKMKGMGLDSLINQLATELGVNGHTLRDDYKAFNEFGGYIKEQLTESPEALMPREYYVLASKVGDSAKVTRYEALQYFQEQRETMGGENGFTYYTDHARRDLKLFNQGYSVEEVTKQDALARKQKVESKKASGSSSVERSLTLHVIATKDNQFYVRQILDKYSSFTAWFEKAAKAEFGKPPKDK